MLPRSICVAGSRNRQWVVIATTGMLSLFAVPCTAQTATGPVTISAFRTGWNAEQFSLESTQTIVNPASCATPDGYISVSSTPGYKAHYGAALAAHLSGRAVWVTVSNTDCDVGRPRIIGLKIASQ